MPEFRISIALATYNGERFLGAQLESLARQRAKVLELVVCDDQSSDGTLGILQAFATRAPFPVRIIRNAQRLGYRDNFLKAAQLCQGDLTAFSDQDDVWLDSKLLVAARCFEDPEIVFVSHSWDVCDEGLRRVRGHKWHRAKIGLGYPWRVSLGFSQVFRRAAFEPLLGLPRVPDFYDPRRSMAHDQWVEFLSAGLGQRAYLPDVLALYRQHGANAFGAAEIGLEQSVRLTLAANSTGYMLRAQCAEAYSEFWSSTAGAFSGRRPTRLAETAHRYWSTLARWLRLRADLYRTASIRRRLAILLGMIRSGAYRSRHSAGLGSAAALKDLAVSVLWLNRRAQ